MPIPKDYCRYEGKKCMCLRVKFPLATCKKTAMYSRDGSEKTITTVKDVKEDIVKPKWCTKKYH